MTPPPEGLGQRFEHETDHRADHPSAEVGDAELGKHIWGRYGDSPGVISVTAALGLTRRINRWSAGRLPLLAGVQRRWVPADASFSLGSMALPYPRWPVVAPVRSPSTDPAFPAPGKPPPAFGGVGSLPVTAAPASVQRATVVPSAEDVRRLNPPIEETRGRATSEGSRQGQTASPPPTAGSRGAVALPRDSGGSTGQVIQRKVTLPALPANTGQNVRPFTSSGERVPNSQPVLRGPPKRIEAEMASPVATRTRDPRTSVLRRQVVQRRDTAPELEDLALARTAEVHKEVGPPTLPAEGAPRPRPAARETPGLTAAEMAPPVLASARTLGTAILQRHLGGPAWRAVQSVGRMSTARKPSHLARLPATEIQLRTGRTVSPGEGVPRLRSVAGGAQRSPESWMDVGAKLGDAKKTSPWEQFSPFYGQSSRIAQGVVPHGQTNLNRIQMAFLPVTRVSDPGISIVQRYLAGTHGASQGTFATLRVRGQAQRQHAWGQVSPGAGTEAMGTLQRHLGEAVPSDIGGSQQVPRDAFASVKSTRLAAPPAVQRVAWSPATHSGRTPGAIGPRLPLFGSSGPGVGRATAAGRSGGTLPARRLTASPVSAVAPVAGAAGSRTPLLVQRRKDHFGDPLAMPLQRATAESPATGPAAESASTAPAPPTGEPSSPGGPTPGPEGPDLERLADKVYAIIEQRLTIERESLGL